MGGYADRTILQEATISGRQNVLRWLLHELKFDVNEQDSYGWTALHVAACDNQRWLLHGCIGVNEQESDGWTALHVAACSNQMECARLLLDAGSQHLKNQSGRTPLDFAKTHRQKEMQRLIISHFQLN